jgi:Uridine phosphorylase
MCASQGLRAGMVAGVIVNRTQQEIPNAETMTAGVVALHRGYKF